MGTLYFCCAIVGLVSIFVKKLLFKGFYMIFDFLFFMCYTLMNCGVKQRGVINEGKSAGFDT